MSARRKRDRDSSAGDEEESTASSAGGSSSPTAGQSARKRRAPLSTVTLFDRRVYVKEDAPLYCLLRSWVKNHAASSKPAREAPTPQTLPPPLPPSELSTQRHLPRQRQTTNSEDILHSMRSVPREVVLASHLTYFRSLKKWWQVQRCHRLARFRERLRQLGLSVDDSGEVNFVHEVEGLQYGDTGAVPEFGHSMAFEFGGGTTGTLGATADDLGPMVAAMGDKVEASGGVGGGGGAGGGAGAGGATGSGLGVSSGGGAAGRAASSSGTRYSRNARPRTRTQEELAGIAGDLVALATSLPRT